LGLRAFCKSGGTSELQLGAAIIKTWRYATRHELGRDPRSADLPSLSQNNYIDFIAANFATSEPKSGRVATTFSLA